MKNKSIRLFVEYLSRESEGLSQITTKQMFFTIRDIDYQVSSIKTMIQEELVPNT